MPLHIDFVIQCHFVAMHASESPIAGGTFIDTNFNILVSDADFFLDAIEQQTNQLFLGCRFPAANHSDFDDRIGIGSAAGREQVVFFQREESVRPLVLRKLQRFHHAFMNHIGQLPLDGVEMVFNPVDFDLCHLMI